MVNFLIYIHHSERGLRITIQYQTKT